MSCTPASLIPFPKCCGASWLRPSLADPYLLPPGKPLTTSLACKSETLTICLWPKLSAKSEDSRSHLISSSGCLPRQTSPPSSSSPSEMGLLEQTPQWLLVPSDVIENGWGFTSGSAVNREESLGSTWLTTLQMGAFWALIVQKFELPEDAGTQLVTYRSLYTYTCTCAPPPPKHTTAFATVATYSVIDQLCWGWSQLKGVFVGLMQSEVMQRGLESGESSWTLMTLITGICAADVEFVINL